MADDDSRSVASAAAAALDAAPAAPTPAAANLARTTSAPAVPQHTAVPPSYDELRLAPARPHHPGESAVQPTRPGTARWPCLRSYLLLYVAVMAAGAGGLILGPGDKRLYGAAALIGTAAASVWGLGFLSVELAVSEGLEAGFWFQFVSHLLLLLAAGLATAVLVQTTMVRLSSRPSGPVAWLVALLGLASAVALLLFTPKFSQFGFTWWEEIPWFCAGGIALVVPAAAALAAPRRFAVALLAGWIGGGAAFFLYSYLYVTAKVDQGYTDDRVALGAFGGTLLALLVTAIWYARVPADLSTGVAHTMMPPDPPG